MKRRVLLLVVFVLMEVLFVVATAAPVLAAAPRSPFGAPPGAAPGNFLRSGTANEHDLTFHATGARGCPSTAQRPCSPSAAKEHTPPGLRAREGQGVATTLVRFSTQSFREMGYTGNAVAEKITLLGNPMDKVSHPFTKGRRQPCRYLP